MPGANFLWSPRLGLVLKPDPNPSGSPYRTSFITDVIAVPGIVEHPHVTASRA